MTAEYTPMLDEVRLAHAESVTLHKMKEPELSEANAMFDRFIAEIRRDQAEKDAALIKWPETAESYKIWGSLTSEQRNYIGRFGVEAIRAQFTDN